MSVNVIRINKNGWVHFSKQWSHLLLLDQTNKTRFQQNNNSNRNPTDLLVFSLILPDSLTVVVEIYPASTSKQWNEISVGLYLIKMLKLVFCWTKSEERFWFTKSECISVAASRPVIKHATTRWANRSSVFNLSGTNPTHLLLDLPSQPSSKR